MRYNLFYTTDKGSQLIDYSNFKSDLEKYIEDFSDKLEGEFEIIEKKTLIDIRCIKVPHSYKPPKPQKLSNYRKICDNCTGKLLESNPIVIQEKKQLSCRRLLHFNNSQGNGSRGQHSCLT